jgi:uncharacterized protein GlcG (DUF336 family)
MVRLALMLVKTDARPRDWVVVSEGGTPIPFDGRIVAAIGINEATHVQDGSIAAEGLKALR